MESFILVHAKCFRLVAEEGIPTVDLKQSEEDKWIHAAWADLTQASERWEKGGKGSHVTLIWEPYLLPMGSNSISIAQPLRAPF